MNQPASDAFVDTAKVRKNFARAAGNYASSAFLAREIDRRMLARLDYVRLAPRRLLDLGCSSGASLTALRARYAKAELYGVDFTLPMLQAAQQERGFLQRLLLPFIRPQGARFIAADAAGRLPFAANSFDLAWSNLLLYWLDDPRLAFREVARTLDVGGLFMFSTFGPDTLQELDAAFADGSVRRQRFTDMHDLGDMLLECGFADPVVDAEILTLTYAKAEHLLQEIAAAGETCAMLARPRGLCGRNKWQQMHAALTALASDGRIPATFEVIYGHAWKTTSTLPAKTAEGHNIVRFQARPAAGK